MKIKNNRLIKVTNHDIINGTFETPNNINKIEKRTFKGCTNLKSINLPDNITVIESSAFEDCTNLQSINLPDNVIKIGHSAFWNCTNLQSITIPDNIIKIGERTFKDCTNLKSINLPNSITVIEDYAFWGCTNLQSINLPDNITEIGYGAFGGCTNLQSINLPDNVTVIKSSAFEDCTNLQSINLPDNVTVIENYAFWGCTNLQSIKLPDNVTEIGYGAFGGCTNLQSIKLPDNVTEIGHGAFKDCTNLQSINLPDNVTVIEDYVFWGCTNLQSITISNNRPYIKDYAFRNCPGLDTIIVSENIVYTDLDRICEQIQNNNETKHFNINMNSSLFNIIDSIFNSNLSMDSVSNYFIKDLIIYNTQINLTELKNSYKKNIKYIKKIITNTYIDEIRKKELLDKIKDKLEHNNITNKNYFTYSEHQNIINTIIYNINNSTDYNYRKDLEQYIKEYIKNKKTSLITLNTIENNLNNKNILEVTNDLKNYQIKKLNTNEYMELFNFGSELNIYPLYISTTLHNTVTHFSKDIKIHQIKQKFDELTTISNKESFLKKLFFKYDNDNITLNKEILEELNNSINNELTSSEKEIQILNELKELIIIYIKKLEEHINYLENYNLDFVNIDIIDESDSLLKNNIKIEKIESFKNSIILIQEKYIQINLIINSNLIYMDKLNNLRINLLPNLISKIMTNNVIKNDLKNIQEFIEIYNTLNEIIDNQNNIESNIKNDNFTLDNNEKNKQFYKKL